MVDQLDAEAAESEQEVNDALLTESSRGSGGNRFSRRSLALGVVLACALVGVVLVSPSFSSHIVVMEESSLEDVVGFEQTPRRRRTSVTTTTKAMTTTSMTTKPPKCGSDEDLDAKCQNMGGDSEEAYCRAGHKTKCCIFEHKGVPQCCKNAHHDVKTSWLCKSSAHCNYGDACDDACAGEKNSTQCLECHEQEEIKCCVNGGTPANECCKYASENTKNNATFCGCAATGGANDCSKSGCCQDPSKTCYEKNEHWGTCKDHNTCTPGVDPHDHKDHKTPWSCHKLSCAENYKDDCRHGRCCQDDNAACYMKNEHWASCRPKSVGCEKGSHDPHDPEEHATPWDCAVISCAADYTDDCRVSKCCQNPQSTCFKKNDEWAACKPICTSEDPYDTGNKTEWACDVVKNWGHVADNWGV